MSEEKRDKTKVNPISGAEDPTPARPLATTAEGEEPSASTVEIPGTGEVIKDKDGDEAKRVVRT